MKKEELFKFRISKELKDLLESKSQYVNMSASEFLRQFISSSNINVKINNKKIALPLIRYKNNILLPYRQAL